MQSMGKIRYLDGLRGLAAFVVVIHHFILAFYPALFFGFNTQTHLGNGFELFMSGSVFNVLYNGNFAVCIFFVLSGFVLSHKFFLKRDKEIVTEGAIKRYVRLALPVAISVFLAFFLLKISLFYNQPLSGVTGSSWFYDFWTVKPNFTDALNEAFIGAFFLDIFDYNVVLWTIAYELFGSFLIFAFLALFGKMRNRYLAYIMVGIYFFNTYYVTFLLGMLLSDIMVNRSEITQKLGKNKVLFLVLLCLGLFLGSYPSGRGTEGTIYSFLNVSFFDDPSISWHMWGAFLVIAALMHLEKIQKALSLKYFLFLGNISFSMYLLHFIILGSFSSLIFLQLHSFLSYGTAFLITFFLSVGLIFLVSHVVYVYVDTRAVQLSKLLYERVFRRTEGGS